MTKNIEPLSKEHGTARPSSERAVYGILHLVATARLRQVDNGASRARTRPHAVHFRSIEEQQGGGGMQDARDDPVPVFAWNGQLDRTFPEAIKPMQTCGGSVTQDSTGAAVKER
jgi:hypothetical protein